MKKRILSCLLSIAMCLTLLPLGTQAQAAYFRDVPSSHWAKDYIDEAVDLGLFNGTGDGQFSPGAAMTRSMFVTVLYRMDGGEAESSANFTDVPRGSWYSDAVAWASENSLVTGTGGGRFSPKANVTREQLITILYRYLNFFGATLEGSGTSVTFRDSSSISSYARPAVQAMKDAGIIGGKPDGYGGYRFDPRGRATRAEVASIMCRFLESLNYDDIDSEEPDPEAAYEQMDKITQSSTLKSLSSQYANASDSQKKNLAEQAISYFEKQEENGAIDYCDVDRDNGVISYEIDGCKFAYFLREIGAGDTSGSISNSTNSNQFVISNSTIFDNASNLVGAASSVSYKGNALILDYYSKNSSDDQAGDFHLITENAEDCFRKVGHTPKTIYGYKVSDLKQGLNNYNFIDFNSHGNIVGNEPVLCLSEASNPQTYLIDYADDVKAGTIGCYGNLAGTFGGNRYYVYGSFFPAHYSGNNKLHARWVHLGSCYGFAGSNQLAAGLSEAGAESVTGYADTVSTIFNAFYEVALFERMTSGYTLSKALDPAYNDAKDEVMENISLEDAKKWNMPRLKLYGKGNLEFRVTDDNTGRIKVSLSPDSGTISEGTYTLDRIRSDNSEQGVFSGKEFSGSSFEITGLQSGMTYRLTVKVKNYASAKAKIVASDSPDTTTISLTYDPPKPLSVGPIATTQVTVRDLDKNKLKNASVTLYGKKDDSDSFTKLASGTTNEYGRFIVDDVNISYTTLKAEASLSGYISGSTEQSFSSKNKDPRYIDVTLDTEKSLEPDDSKYDGYTKVYSAREFNAIIKDRGDDANLKILLMDDIGGVSTDKLMSIDRFCGILEGNNHRIDYAPLYSDDSDYFWIHENLGVIQNLYINIGGLNADYGSWGNGESFCGLIAVNDGIIRNCTIVGQLGIKGNSADALYVGGFVGRNSSRGSIEHCVNMMSATSAEEQLAAYAGGIAGINQGVIYHCLNLANIKSVSNRNNSAYAAGIAARNEGTVKKCGNDAEIETTVLKDRNDISNCLLLATNSIDGYVAVDDLSGDDMEEGNGYTFVSHDYLRSMWSDVLN